jgi:hypothetical protein
MIDAHAATKTKCVGRGACDGWHVSKNSRLSRAVARYDLITAGGWTEAKTRVDLYEGLNKKCTVSDSNALTSQNPYA